MFLAHWGGSPLAPTEAADLAKVVASSVRASDGDDALDRSVRTTEAELYQIVQRAIEARPAPRVLEVVLSRRS